MELEQFNNRLKDLIEQCKDTRNLDQLRTFCLDNHDLFWEMDDKIVSPRDFDIIFDSAQEIKDRIYSPVVDFFEKFNDSFLSHCENISVYYDIEDNRQMVKDFHSHLMKHLQCDIIMELAKNPRFIKDLEELYEDFLKAGYEEYMYKRKIHTIYLRMELFSTMITYFRRYFIGIISTIKKEAQYYDADVLYSQDMVIYTPKILPILTHISGRMDFLIYKQLLDRRFGVPIDHKSYDSSCIFVKFSDYPDDKSIKKLKPQNHITTFKELIEKDLLQVSYIDGYVYTYDGSKFIIWNTWDINRRSISIMYDNALYGHTHRIKKLLKSRNNLLDMIK